MKLLTVTSSKIRPVQIAVNLYGEKRSIENSIKTVLRRGYDPLPVINYNGEYILCDGHHTSAGLFLLTNPFAIKVLESDNEIRGYNLGVIKSCNTINEAIETLKQPLEFTDEMGISKIWDLLVWDNPHPPRKLSQISLPELLAA